VCSNGIVLEMTNPAQLSAARRQDDLVLTQVSAAAGDRIGALYRAIWEPIGGGGRGSWTDDQWATELAPAGVKAFVGQIEDADIAMAQLGWSGNGDAGLRLCPGRAHCSGEGEISN